MSYQIEEGITIEGEDIPRMEEVLTSEAVHFLANLHRQFNERRLILLQQRKDRQSKLDKREFPSFLPETQAIREDSSWRIDTPPRDLSKRWVEITGPTDRKMMINAFNSGANVFMADFEDANVPTWNNMIEGQANLREAVDGTISFTSPEGKKYALKDQIATLMVRPRGWHLSEKHLFIDGEPISGSLFDFGLYIFHNHQKLLKKGTAPYFYLAKLESHLEARLWNDVFIYAQEKLGMLRGTIKATVLIETILAAFEMEEILFELREHSAGLNAGRWDYIFSIIKKFNKDPDLLLPDRGQITMTVPFMRAYTELLVKTCHKRGAQALGGMAAFIPSRKDTEINKVALAKVRDDKLRESRDGFDGTWVAHPDLVPVAREVFEQFLGSKPNQVERQRDEVKVSAGELLNFTVPGGTITESGVRQNIQVALRYLESWLRGVGAVAIFNLMEDTATAEISRSQLWQWVHQPRSRMVDGRQVNFQLYQNFAEEELQKIKDQWGSEGYALSKFEESRKLLDFLVSNEKFIEFLTIVAYDDL